MRVLVVSGIWPPDVGGPASHAPDVAAFLQRRGHDLEVVVTAGAAPAPRPYAVRWTPRRLPVGVRHVHAAALVAARARRADVVYSTGMFVRTAVAARLTRTPYVLKLTGDPAFERARARGLALGEVGAWQARRGLLPRALGAARDWSVSGAAHVYCPSAYLRELAIGWGAPPERVEVLPNPAPAVPELPSRAELRRSFALHGATLAFAGRLTAQKALDVAFEAVARTPDVELVVAGDGPERTRLERVAADRVRFLGPLGRDEVLRLFAAADAAVLSSAWENFPHSVVEALAVGTPVIASDVGGVAEVVRDGENGLLVPPGDAAALADAVKRFFADAGLRRRLAAAAAPSVAEYAEERLFAQLEDVLRGAAA